MIIIRAQRITKMQMVAIERSAHMASSNPTRKFCKCILCSRTIEKPRERYLVSGKTKFNASEALRQLPFDVLEIHFTFVDSVSINYANEPLFLLKRNSLSANLN